MSFLTLRPSDPISPWEKKRTGSQTLPATPRLPTSPSPLPLQPKPTSASPDRHQSLKEETGFGMPLEISPQVHNYALIALLSFPLTANLSLCASERSAAPAKCPASHSVSSFSPSLLSALGHPRQRKTKKKIAVLVPGQSAGAERRGLGWEMGR